MAVPVEPDLGRRLPRDDHARVLQRLAPLALELVRELRPQAADRLQIGPVSRIDRDLGIDSLGRVELLARIERAFQVRLPTRLATEADTIEDLIRAVMAGSGTSDLSVAIAALPPAPLPAAAVPAAAETLPDILLWHAERHPDHRHALVLTDDGDGRPIGYGELAAKARQVAAGLLAAGAKPGDRIALMTPTCPDFLWGFFGSLFAGCVPVPIYPPARMAQLEEHLLRQRGILRNAGAAYLLVTAELRGASRLIRPLVESLRGACSVADMLGAEDACPSPRAAPDGLALLQYTSGSTGDPKGVMLRHANLLANIRAMGQAMNASPQDVFVSWLPLYHDMGLIGAWLGSLYFGVPLLLMSPQRFLAHPEDWLWAIHHARATLSAAPNFAFELCAGKLPDAAIEGLDLSSLRMVLNGAEPVSARTLRRFQARFGPHGFRAEAMAPVYGLAECSVGLAFPPPGRPPPIDRIERSALAEHGEARPAGPAATDAVELVACGRPLPGHAIRIVDEAGREVGERHEGRIQFRGPSATSGYFRNPEKTRRLFDGDWLETGDLGYLALGDLYVTGRSKDLIIRAGRNIHPQEIEEAVGGLPGVRRGCVVVAGEPVEASGTERVVVLAEAKESEAAARLALRERIAACIEPLLGGPADEIVLLPPRTIPKTSSGKLRRSAALELHRSGRLGVARLPIRRQALGLVLLAAGERLRRERRRLAAWAYGGWWWSVVGLFGGLGWLLAIAVPGRTRRWRLLHRLARLALVLAGHALRVNGLERLPRGPGLLVANHSSYLDGLVLVAAVPRPLAFAVKRELAGQKLAGPFLRRMGCVFVERAAAAGAAEEAPRLQAAIAADPLLVIFPEGTFDRAPGLLPFHLGAFQAAAGAGCAVIPLAIRGTRSILRAEQWLPRPGAIEVDVLAAVTPRGTRFADLLALRDAARAAILDAVGEPDLSTGMVALPPARGVPGACPTDARLGACSQAARPEVGLADSGIRQGEDAR